MATQGSLNAQRDNRKWTWPVTDPIYSYTAKRHIQVPFALLHLQNSRTLNWNPTDFLLREFHSAGDEVSVCSSRP